MRTGAPAAGMIGCAAGMSITVFVERHKDADAAPIRIGWRGRALVPGKTRESAMGFAPDFDFSAERARVQRRLERASRALREAAGEAGSRAFEDFEQAREQAADLARIARKRGRDAALIAASEVRRHPASYGLAAVVGIAAVALLLSPRLRKLVADVGEDLVDEIKQYKGSLRL